MRERGGAGTAEVSGAEEEEEEEDGGDDDSDALARFEAALRSSHVDTSLVFIEEEVTRLSAYFLGTRRSSISRNIVAERLVHGVTAQDMLD